MDFNILGVETGDQGEVVLRLGTGRDFFKSLQPEVAFNGTAIPVPENWRGDGQDHRDRYFGVLEIPVPYELLQEDNLVSVTFPVMVTPGGKTISASA